MNETNIALSQDSLHQYDSDDCDSEYQEERINDDFDRDQINPLKEIAVCNPPKLPYFKSVSVVNSNDVHFGNKTIYKGPVTIKQFVYPSGEVISECVGDSKDTAENVDFKNAKNGVCNPTFVDDEKEIPKSACEKDSLSRSNSFSLFNKEFLCCCLTLRNHRYKAFIFIGSVIITVVIVLAVLYAKNSSIQGNNSYVPGHPFTEGAIPPHRRLRMIPRNDWLAQPPSGPLSNLTLPVPFIIIQHTATESCQTQSKCVLLTRNIQNFHIESHKWFDIGYNFLIGGDGAVYEGRGWTKEGAHTYSYNNISLGIAFIGTYTQVAPPPIMRNTFDQLIEFGVELKYLFPNYKILAHRQLIATESPGQAFFNEIKKWPHWSRNISFK